MTPYLLVLRIKSFRNLWLAQIASQIAVNMMAFVLTIQVYEQTRSNIAVSLLVLAIGLPALGLGSVAGVFVDRWDKRTVLFWCNMLRALLLGCLFFFRESLPLVFMSAIVVSTITQFFVPAEGPLIPKFVSPNLLLPANSLFTFTYYASVAGGFISSGPLIRLWGPQGIFLFISFFLLIAGWFSYLLPRDNTKNIQSDKTNFKEFREELRYGFSYLKARKPVLEALLLFTASQAFLTTLAALSPGFADRILQIELTDASVIVMGPAIVGLILAALLIGALSKYFSDTILETVGILGVGVSLLILSLFIRIGNRPEIMQSMEHILPASLQLERLDVAILLFFLMGVFNGMIVVPLNAQLQLKTEERVRGRIYGMLSALSGGVSILPVIGAGSLADTIGVGKTLFGLSLMVLSFGAYRLKLSKKR